MKCAYFIDSEKHKSDFKKGFLQTSYMFMSKNMPNIFIVWKASEFYDDMLNPKGILLAVNAKKIHEDKFAEKFWQQVFEICKKNRIENICMGEIDVMPSKPNGFNIYTADVIRFVYNVCNYLKQSDKNINSEIGVVISGRNDEIYLKYLSDKFNYIKIYSSNRMYALKLAEDLMKYNGTAIQITGSLGEMISCEVIFVLNDLYSDKMKYFSDKIIIVDVFRESESLHTSVYTNKLGKLILNSSYLEYSFMQGANKKKDELLTAAEEYLLFKSIT